MPPYPLIITPLSGIFGLSLELTLLLVIVALAVLGWGFERYRTTFSRLEFGLALLVSLSILIIGVFPGVFVFLTELFDLSESFRAVQITANVAFVFLLLYVVSLINSNRNRIDELSRGLTVQQATLRQRQVGKGGIYVILPAYNEGETIGKVLSSLPDELFGYPVRAIVVSDGSEDETTQIALEHDAIVVEHPLNQGQGGAIKTGFEIANRNAADVVVTMDADGQHPADQLSEIVEPIVNGEADYVLGSRYRGQDRSGNSLVRDSGIRVFTSLINVMAKTDITDCTNGFRAIRGSRLHQLTLTEERFSAPELIIEARKNGLRITEVPVTIQQREAGETKKPTFSYALGLFRTILITWIR